MQRSIPPSENPRQATVAIEFVRGMLAGLDRRSIDTKDFLRQVGLDLADDASRIPVDRYAALYNLLNRTFDDEAFCLFAQPMRVGSFEFLCRGSLSAPTLGEALARMGRFLRLILPDLKVSIRRQHGQAELVIAETRRLAATPDDPGRIFAFEWLLRLLHGLSCWLVARGLALDSVLFPYRRPKHSADYALIFTEDSRFAPTVPGGTGTFPALVNDWIPFSQDPAGYVNQIALPAISLAIPVAGSLTRVVRTAMVEELDKDYVRTAIGAGIPKPVVIARNVLRNALITPITLSCSA